jgi:hypothetical protein
MRGYEFYQDIPNLFVLELRTKTKFHAVGVFSGSLGHVIAFNVLNKPFNLNYI